jgi:hypothetical protein
MMVAVKITKLDWTVAHSGPAVPTKNMSIAEIYDNWQKSIYYLVNKLHFMSVYRGVMDQLDTLAVRFHLRGQFDFDGHDLRYIGGRVEMSHIERNKL